MSVISFKQYLAENGSILPLLYGATDNTNSFTKVKGVFITPFTPVEGLTVPDGASAEFTKTVPLGINMTDYFGIVLDTSGQSNSDVPKSYLNSLRYSGIYGPNSTTLLYVSRMYQKSRVLGEAMLHAGGYKINLVYQDCISSDEYGLFLGAYTGGGTSRAPVPTISAVNTNAGLVSVHIDGNNLVLKYKKVHSTSSVSFSSGCMLIFHPI
jgi:hypothetical protein